MFSVCPMHYVTMWQALLVSNRCVRLSLCLFFNFSSLIGVVANNGPMTVDGAVKVGWRCISKFDKIHTCTELIRHGTVLHVHLFYTYDVIFPLGFSRRNGLLASGTIVSTKYILHRVRLSMQMRCWWARWSTLSNAFETWMNRAWTK